MALEVTHLLLHVLQKLKSFSIESSPLILMKKMITLMELSKRLLLSPSRRKADVMGTQLYLGMEHGFFLYYNYKVLIFPGQTAVS